MKYSSLLVTGGCGFIGSNFINYMTRAYPDSTIVNLDCLQYCANTSNVNPSANYHLVIGDLNNAELIRYILEKHKVDTVVHFAAQTHVDNSFGNSLQFTKDNVLGTHTLLECCRVYGKIQRFVHISTDEVYGEVDIEHAGCHEKSLLNPTNPYAATKAAAEFLVRSYYHSFGLPIIITRGNNVYGPRQYPEKLIPKCITRLANHQPCLIQGTGHTRRNFIHVDDVSKAVDIILQRGKVNHIYNIGTKNEFSVLQIVEKLIANLKPNEPLDKWIRYIEDRNFNDFRYAIDNQALRDLGWTEDVSFEEGLKHTVDWYVERGSFVSNENHGTTIKI